MPFQDFATNGRQIECQRPLPQASSSISPSLQTHFCYVRHEIVQLVVCAWNITLASSLHHQSEAESCKRCSDRYAGW